MTQDIILKIDELVQERPRTKQEILERLEVEKPVLDKKIEILWELGKVKLHDASWGERIVHKKFSAGPKSIEESIPRTCRDNGGT